MLPILVAWIVAIAVGAALWTRYTRPPAASTVRVPGQTFAPRRVIPVWLVLVLLILLVVVLWVTVRWAPLASARP